MAVQRFVLDSTTLDNSGFGLGGGAAFILDTSTLDGAAVLDGGEFVTSDWERVQGQLADYATMHFYGQLTTNNRSKLGVINNITG